MFKSDIGYNFILFILIHHGEADPDLLIWIKDLLDQIIGISPWMIVIVIGLIVIAIPIGVMALFLAQQKIYTDISNRSEGADLYSANCDSDSQ